MQRSAGKSEDLFNVGRSHFHIFFMSSMAVETKHEHVTKKARTDQTDFDPTLLSVEDCFSESFTDPEHKEKLKQAIAESSPYKYGIIRPLINDELLRAVRREIQAELHFTKKETDIYKVFQTGDLANISALDATELSRLKSLTRLRDALYSEEFREYLSYVCNSGPLSGIKKDLSVNVYQKGSHLLNHDDVIGSRRISYILYLPNPDEEWNPKWGGALRLYRTVVPNIPEPDWTKSIPPGWNQLAFFTVQPGLSFHDVEEVYVDKPRLSISGWFHIPQKGEDGYIESEQEETDIKSSLGQLESSAMKEYDYPKIEFTGDEYIGELDDSDVEYLKKYLRDDLLTQDVLDKLQEKFCDESIIEIKDFLNPEYARNVKAHIDADDLSDNVPQTSQEVEAPWDTARPPHKAKYLFIDQEFDSASVQEKPDLQAHKKLAEIRQLFASASFKKWLKRLSAMTPKQNRVVVRRFRPGHDFTLATANDSRNLVLDATLNLTPSKGWQTGELGGYELCMSFENDDNMDPAVYRGGDGSDSVLATNYPSWNVFHLFLRDEGILKFVKYVSRNAPGSRWDVTGEWIVDDDEEEDGEREDRE